MDNLDAVMGKLNLSHKAKKHDDKDPLKPKNSLSPNKSNVPMFSNSPQSPVFRLPTTSEPLS